jgi:hypothetical protein
MDRRSVNNLWFRQRVREAHDAAADGRRPVAIDLFRDLAEQRRDAAADSLSTWHEIQALWLLGVELEGAGQHADAARTYSRIVTLRRAELREASDGLCSALAAAALCEFRAGHRRAGVKLAREVLTSHGSRVSKRELQLLKAEVGKTRSPNSPTRRKSKAGGA